MNAPTTHVETTTRIPETGHVLNLIPQPLVRRLNRRAAWQYRAFNLIIGLLIGAGVMLELQLWMGLNDDWSIGVGLMLGLMLGLGL